MGYAIIDRGRGPEIDGSRITVYDVLAETQAGASAEQLAQWYELDIGQIRLALQYIEEHKEEVLRDWQEIKARHAQAKPVELEAKLRAIAAKYGPLWEERQRQMQDGEQNGEWPPRGY